MELKLLVATTLALMTAASAANAKVVHLPSSKGGGDSETKYLYCRGEFMRLGLGDVITAVEGSSYTIEIKASGGNNTEWPDDGKAFDGISGTGSLIHWTPITPAGRNVGNCPEDACAELMHELAHARNAALGKDYKFTPCGSGYLLDTAEVEATRLENAYRSAAGLCIRTIYDYNYSPVGGGAATEAKVPPPFYAGASIPPGASAVTCATPPPKLKPSGGCGSGCSASIIGASGGGCNGDPHMRTFDQLAYDFHAIGDFTLFKSTVDGMEVQTRMASIWAPYENMTGASAIAANVAGDRLEVYANMSFSAKILLNGSETTVPAGGLALPNGGVLSIDDKGHITTVWPDGSVLIAQPLGAFGLSVVAYPNPARAGSLSGLLGNFDGLSSNDLVPRGGGTPLPIPPAYSNLYPGFANSWRTTASLFTYPTTEPNALPTAAPPVISGSSPAGAVAAAACANAGVSEPTQLASCIYDIARTGLTCTASDLSRLMDDGWRLTFSTPTVGSISFYGTAGQRLFVEVPRATLPEHCGAFDIYDPFGTKIPPVGLSTESGCILGTLPSRKGYWETQSLPYTGWYSLKVDTGGGTGSADFRLYSPVDPPDGVLAVDGPAVAATISNRGAVARLSFYAFAGHVLKIDGTTNLPEGCGHFRVKNEAGSDAFPGKSGCVIGGAAVFNAGGTTSDPLTIATSGTYSIVVDPPGSIIGRVNLSVHH